MSIGARNHPASQALAAACRASLWLCVPQGSGIFALHPPFRVSARQMEEAERVLRVDFPGATTEVIDGFDQYVVCDVSSCGLETLAGCEVIA